MPRFLRRAPVWFSLLAVYGQENVLTPAESKDGWLLLFDGRTLSGWEARPTSVPEATGDWAVRAGAISCPGKTPGWLGSVGTFGHYILKLEFRGAATANSGVFLRSEKEGRPHITGYELQIWDEQPAGFNTGSLVGAVKASPAKILPYQWNRYVITADKDHFVAVLNGTTLLDVRNAQHPNAGVIGFQCQAGNAIEFRNIKVQPLRN